MNILYKHNFMGHLSSNVVQSWYETDNIKNLSKNLKTMPNDWYYGTNEITYSFNSLGHRSKELGYLDLDNYALFAGCSNTLGVGLELSKTYPYLVSHQLKCDYYNLGLCASGIDAMLHNLIVWRSVVTKLPKVLVIQWPATNRYLTTHYGSMFYTRGSWHKVDSVENFLLAGEDANFFQTRKILASKIIETIFNCTIIQMSIDNQDRDSDNHIIKLVTSDYARDMRHPGIMSNSNFADRIYEEILNKIQTA